MMAGAITAMYIKSVSWMQTDSNELDDGRNIQAEAAIYRTSRNLSYSHLPT